MPGEEYDVRQLRLSDAAALVDAYVSNREHLAPWEPLRPADFYTVEGQRAVLEQKLQDVAEGRAGAWVVTHGAEIVGMINMNNVVRGAFQSCSLGYWIAAAHTRKGLATRAVSTACEHATASGLHRVEAATILRNVASQAVLSRCGFTPFGTAPDYLFIAGRWEDHRLFQRILHDQPLH